MKLARKIINWVLLMLLAGGAVILVVYMASREGGYTEAKGTYHSPTVFAMDTTLDITIQGRDKAQAKADSAAVIAVARKIENETSMFKAGSDVQKVNAQAGVAPVQVNDSTLFLARTAVEYAQKMGGAFDVTIAPVVRLWGFYDQKYRVPSPEEVSAALRLVDYRDIVLDEANRSVMLRRKGMEMDLGGIAKGYAVSEMARVLKERGVLHALINFGGAIGAVGNKVDGQDWVVGIKDPRSEGGALMGELKINDDFVSTSGDYERYFIKGGKRYFHIFDPATGYNPVGVISTTIVGPNGTLCDTLSKILVMGVEKGLDFMKTQPEYQALIVDSSGKVFFTPQMKSKYVISVEDRVI
jgi:thiamine biosynthesis lipoprotein